MTQMMYIDKSSMKNLNVNMKTFQADVLRSALTGLRQFGMRIVIQAQEFIQHNGSVASDKLRGSGRTIVQPDNTVDAGFYCAYAQFVEEGRGPGGMPPVDDIEQWILRKGRRRDKEGKSALASAAVFSGKSEKVLARRAAWAISKSIKDHGTKPHPFLKPAYEMYRLKITEFIQQKINECCEKYKKK